MQWIVSSRYLIFLFVSIQQQAPPASGQSGPFGNMASELARLITPGSGSSSSAGGSMMMKDVSRIRTSSSGSGSGSGSRSRQNSMEDAGSKQSDSSSSKADAKSRLSVPGGANLLAVPATVPSRQSSGRFAPVSREASHADLDEPSILSESLVGGDQSFKVCVCVQCVYLCAYVSVCDV